MNKDFKIPFLILEARRWVGTTEVGGNNKGQLVEMWQKSVDKVAQGEPWCFTGDTEIYTENGWIRFDELCTDVKVAQVSDKEISFALPLNYTKKEYTGKGWHIKTRSIDLICDKGHRFFGNFNGAKQPRFGTLDECSSHLRIEFMKSSEKTGVSLSQRQLQFLAAFLSDGFYSKTRNGKPRIRIQVSKKRKIDVLRSMSPIGEYTASKCYGASKTPLTTFSYLVPDWFEDIFDDYKVVKWSFINSLTADQAAYFLNCYCKFDGYINGNSNQIFSSRKQLADQILSLCLIAGYSPSMNYSLSPISQKPCFIVRWVNQIGVKLIRNNNLFEIDLDDTLYCVSVPDQRIIVRGQNGTPLVVGNCMGFVQAQIAWVDKVIYEITGDTSFSKVFKSEHCLTVWNKTPRDLRSAVPLPGSIAIWRKKGTISGHAGIVTSVLPSYRKFLCVEGNTGPGDGTIVRDGDGVYEKNRSMDGEGSMLLLGFLIPWS